MARVRLFGTLYRVATKSKALLGTALAFLAVLGIFTFPLFILEEATQMTVWGTWQADKNSMYILKEGIQVVERLNATAKFINSVGGWLHPLSYKSYKGWTAATDFWIMASKTKVLAFDPKLMDGEEVEILFRPDKTELETDRTILKNGPVSVITCEPPQTDVIRVSATAKWEHGRLLLDTRSVQDSSDGTCK